jgi:hypothetical protein
MKTMLATLLVALTLSTGMAFGAPPVGSANVAQVDVTTPWGCPTTFTNIPLSLALTTDGGPVLVTFTINTPTSWPGGEGILFEPVIDGQPIPGDQLTVSNSNNWLWPFVFTRVYSLSAGTHTVGGRLACLTNAATMGRAWLYAYELPLIRR